MVHEIALSSTIPRILASRRHWLMVFMLGLLHAAIVLGVENPWSRGVLVSHLGMFLLWQPLWRGEDAPTTGGIVLIAIASLSALLWLNWWLLAFWVTGLFALLGGKIFSFQAKWLRVFYLAGMIYLLATLLLLVAPHLFAPEILSISNHGLVPYTPFVLLALMLLLPVEHEPPGPEQVVDFFYVLMLFMLVVVLVLGSFAVMNLRKQDYPLSLLQTVLLLASLLIILGWLWNPRFGFSGLQQMFSRYLLNIGTPFEQWISKVAEAAEREQDAAGFLEKTAHHLFELPWLEGVKWASPDGEGALGEESKHPIRLKAGQLDLTLSPRYRVGPSVLLHIHLLAQIIARFYEAKRRERALLQITRLQTIYETGARLTHDMKNLLQSLYALASAAQQPAMDQQFRELFKRQLPQLTQRLEITLGKLQTPSAEQSGNFMEAATWWEGAKGRYEGREIRFEGAFTVPVSIPAPLFDCVLDNLLDNALKKRVAGSGLAITATLRPGSGPALQTGVGVLLTVCDSGSPLRESVAAKLFTTTLHSDTGLGIGLYQAAQWARQQGYRLALRSNRPGEVCFELAPGTNS